MGTLKRLSIPKIFLPNVEFPELYGLEVDFDQNISFEKFKIQFEQMLRNVSNLKRIWVRKGTQMTEAMRQYLLLNYEKHFCASDSEFMNIPAKIFFNAHFEDLVSKCKYKSSLEYVQIDIDPEKIDEVNWANFKNCFYDFQNLKGIPFYDEVHYDNLDEADFFPTKESKFEPIFYKTWKPRIQFLKS